MRLAQLRADNFRLLLPLSLRPHRRLNLVVGPNAAGKTSLLEAIYVLGRGKSFRGHSPAELAGPAGRHWGVGGEIGREDAPGDPVRVEWGAQTGTVAALREPAQSLDLVRALPVQILEPGMHRLLQDGPSYRRSFLDWGVFHVEQDFWPAWRRFQRALRQRNAALRAGAPGAEVRAWDAEMAEPGERIAALRRAHLGAIQARFGALIGQLLEVRDWELDLHPGWPRERAYAEVLEGQVERDRRMGTTVEGPHRAELRIRLDAHAARNRVSRGQQKLLIAALLIAQAELIGAAHASFPLLLVDDFTAELAAAYQRALLAVLAAYRGQVWITSFEALAAPADAAMFHVEQGRISHA